MKSLIHASVRYLGFNPVSLLRQTRQMRTFVRSYVPVVKSADQTQHFAVVVMPWFATAVPWFSIACGVFLASVGARVTFVVDTIVFGDNAFRSRVMLGCIRRVLAALSGQFEVLEINGSALKKPLDAGQRASVARFAKLNAVWAMRGEMLDQGRSKYTERSLRQLELSARAIHELFEHHSFDCVLVPGGVYGSTGVWAEIARANCFRLASFDSGGRGIVMLAANGIACQLQDIPRAYELLKADVKTQEERLFVQNTALAELDRRHAGIDRFSSQVRDAGDLDSRFDGAVLFALNSPWDSAALGRHEIFDSSAQWIVESVRYLLERTSARIVVRQHPAERFESGRSSDDYAKLLRENFGDDRRLIFIAAGDPVNSYDLLERVSVVVVYTSTIGIEAALKGKVVITPSSSYYSGLGFVWCAVALDRYQKLLTDAVAGRCVVSQQMRDDALFCYYLTQCCNWVSSPFCPEGFNDWIRIPFEELKKHEQLKATIGALRDNIPISFLMHLSRVRLRAEAGSQ